MQHLMGVEGWLPRKHGGRTGARSPLVTPGGARFNRPVVESTCRGDPRHFRWPVMHVSRAHLYRRVDGRLQIASPHSAGARVSDGVQQRYRTHPPPLVARITNDQREHVPWCVTRRCGPVCYAAAIRHHSSLSARARRGDPHHAAYSTPAGGMPDAFMR